jgi:hypothetical protein
MIIKTTTEANHRHVFTPDSKPKDGGREFLLEVFDYIHEEKQPGKMTVQFGGGGSVASLIFDEPVQKQDITIS